MANAHYGSLYTLNVYTNSVGFGIAYPRKMGNPEPRYAGWAIVQIPALLFSVCFESNNQIQNGFGVLGVAL